MAITTLLSPPPKFRAITNSGFALVGGKVFTYLAGSTTPTPTYADAQKVTTNTNPVILDAKGEANIFLDPANNYKFVVQDSTGASVYTQDDISVTPIGMASLSALSASSGAGLIGYIAGGVGAVYRSVQSRLRDRLTPQDFGSTGNGIDSDTAALQLFFNAIGQSLGGATAGYTGTRGTKTGWIPAAHYIIDGPINIGPYLDIECDKRALFTAKAGYTGVMFYSVDGYQIRWSGGIFQASANGVGGVWWIGNANYPSTPHNADSGYCLFENFEAKGFQDVFPVLVNQSAQMSIRNFKHDRCIHLIGRGTNLNTGTGVYSQTPTTSGYGGFSDVIVIQDAWVTMSDLMSDNYDGVICAKSVRMRNVLFVPVPHSGRECAYVNAWNYAVLDDVRYGGEASSIAPINWMGQFLSAYPVEQSGVVISNSRIYNAKAEQTTLASSITSSDTTITLTDGSIFPITGEMYIGTERVNYIARVGNVFTADTRSSLSFSASAGATVTNKTSTIIRLFSDLPNLISITGNSGGVELNNYISVSSWTSAGGYTAIQTSSSSKLFRSFIEGNNFDTKTGDIGYFLGENTFIDYNRSGSFRERSVTAGSPGLIRTEITSVPCYKAKTYRMRAQIFDGAGPYRQGIEGILSINRFFDGAATVIYGTFTKTSDFDPPSGGSPANIDTVAIKFIYSNGSVTAGNTAPLKDRFIVSPLIELSASTGSIGASATVLWELIE